jgi:broad specificity phosphatase PhoE
VQVLVVRHARAVSKRVWTGADLLRPLDELGRRQAIGLVDTLAEAPVRRLVSSPALRCVETLEPLASHRGSSIETTELLAADGDIRTVLDRLRDGLEDAVLCTHGEVMRPLLRHVRRHHVPIVGDPGGRGSLLVKGVLWRLDIADGGSITQLQAFAPVA